ncbi:MAG: ubiquinone/menaquinone biosynthesis methyltransferase, partial [Acidobacteriota bacterium]|nr:ubiquinone/menaquinone biosynthesis methyltransferase [Acidobacteriota bacterium]
LALSRDRGEAVMGSDFCHPMLRVAARKWTQSPLVEADALRLPIRDGSLDLITVAFGFRNFVDYEAGLREMRRVMRRGGMVAILEFSRPPNPVFRKIYEAYSGRVLPWVGGLISGSRDAYEYLPESVKKFPGAEELAGMMSEAGFNDVRFVRMTLGVVAVHTGRVL